MWLINLFPLSVCGLDGSVALTQGKQKSKVFAMPCAHCIPSHHPKFEPYTLCIAPMPYVYQQVSASIGHFWNPKGAIGESVGFVPNGYNTIRQAQIVWVEGTTAILDPQVSELYETWTSWMVEL
jgi:hypothetical protein